MINESMHKAQDLLWRRLPFKGRNALPFMGLTMVVGIMTMVFALAAGPFSTLEPENGTLSGGASVVNLSGASGGKAVRFGSAPAPTPTPSPSPSPTPTPPPSCALPNYPDAGCTGAPAGTVLSAYNPSNCTPPLLTPKPDPNATLDPTTCTTSAVDGSVCTTYREDDGSHSTTGRVLDPECEITVAGRVVDSKTVNGCIMVSAPNVVIRKSMISCWGNGIYNNSSGLLVEDVEVTCEGKVGGTGITWQNYTARRVNVHDCDNVFWAQNNVVIEDSYIHDPICYSQALDPHTDGIQIPGGGTNITITHNRIYGNYELCDEDGDGDLEPSFGNSAITTGSGLTDLLITNNLLAGGGYTLRCAEDGGPSTNYRVIDNHFSTIFDPHVGGFGPWNDCQNETQVTGNVYHESGQPVPF